MTTQLNTFLVTLEDVLRTLLKEKRKRRLPRQIYGKYNSKMASYDIVLSEETVKDLLQYKTDLLTYKKKAGNYLGDQLKGLSLGRLQYMPIEMFLQMLLSTKKYKCNSDSDVRGDGSDWNRTEFKLIGEISVAMKVQVYDNGVWIIEDNAFKVHDPPMTAQLVFTPGPLLFGKRFEEPTPDFEAISIDGKIIQEKYNNLMKRRLLPIFIYAEEMAKRENKMALIVVPGLGCGVYAKQLKGQMGEHLNKALQSIIKDLARCEHIACIRYDPYNECEDYEEVINSVKYRLRKYTGPSGRPQLSRVEDFEETKGEFENCTLFKVVACDHVAFPGNNYFLGVRKSDDGVTCAATNTMEVLTGKKGHYLQGYYLPPEGNRKWLTVASHNDTKLIVEENVKVAVDDCKLIELIDYCPAECPTS